MPARSRSALASVSIILAAACGQLPSRVTETQEPIYGGALDKTDDAVMALINQTSATTANACSGTTIAVAGGSGIFLTAGHCVVASDGAGHVTTPIELADPANLFVVPGPDWQTSAGGGLYYGVAQVAVHPQYDGSVDSPYDIALIRFLGALSGQPVIPVLPAADDDLHGGLGHHRRRVRQDPVERDEQQPLRRGPHALVDHDESVPVFASRREGCLRG